MNIASITHDYAVKTNNNKLVYLVVIATILFPINKATLVPAIA